MMTFQDQLISLQIIYQKTAVFELKKKGGEAIEGRNAFDATVITLSP